jgi:hypothetical protein
VLRLDFLHTLVAPSVTLAIQFVLRFVLVGEGLLLQNSCYNGREGGITIEIAACGHAGMCAGLFHTILCEYYQSVKPRGNKEED